MRSDLRHLAAMRRRIRRARGFTLIELMIAQLDVFVRHIQAMIDAYDSTSWLARIRCPTLVIAGRQDAIFSLAEHQFIADNISGARLAIVDDCGHGSPMERPQAVTALLRYWLAYS